MGFTARHPRYTIALIVLLFVSILIFANSDPPRYMPGSYVEDHIKRSEAHYQELLKERQKLITKWGPSPNQIDAFPSNGKFYTLCEHLKCVQCVSLLN
jgi:hypothetical protein